ncbi:MAG: hypothetical protein U0325_27230 [Polyangiales bacterium]
MSLDAPFRSAPLRIPAAPTHARPWRSAAWLERLRHAVLIEGTAVMLVAMRSPIRPVTLYRIGSCGDAPRDPGEMCGRSCVTPIGADPAEALRLGVMLALGVAFTGFVLGHTHWFFRPSPDRADLTRGARRGAFCALVYAALGFLVTGFWAPFVVERPVLTPIFLALSLVAVFTRTE